MALNICVLIPVLNEAVSIGHIVENLRKKNLSVLVVDDGSTDISGKIATDKGAIVLRNETREGKGASLRKGFEYVLQRRYDGVITMDGDGQHAVEDIDMFINKASENQNVVINGNRMVNSKGMPFIRLLTNKAMSFMISLSCGQSIADTQCGYRYIGLEILEKISFSTSGFEIETEVLMRSSKLGYQVISVPVKTIYGNEKSKINPVKDTLRFFKYYFKETFSFFSHKKNKEK